MKKTAMPSILVAAILLGFPLIPEAQQPKKVWRIGHLSVSDPATDSWAEAIRLALRELGYIEGENIAIEYRYAEGKPDRAHELATELVRFKVDIIVVAGGDTLVRPVMNGTKTIHIVMMGGGVILSGRAWLKALPVLVATSRVLRFSPEN